MRWRAGREVGSIVALARKLGGVWAPWKVGCDVGERRLRGVCDVLSMLFVLD